MPTTPAKATKPNTPAAKGVKPDAVGARFPRAVSLKGGKKVELRLMGAGDLGEGVDRRYRRGPFVHRAGDRRRTSSWRRW